MYEQYRFKLQRSCMETGRPTCPDSFYLYARVAILESSSAAQHSTQNILLHVLAGNLLMYTSPTRIVFNDEPPCLLTYVTDGPLELRSM
jgi:hypothetical protein